MGPGDISQKSAHCSPFRVFGGKNSYAEVHKLVPTSFSYMNSSTYLVDSLAAIGCQCSSSLSPQFTLAFNRHRPSLMQQQNLVSSLSSHNSWALSAHHLKASIQINKKASPTCVRCEQHPQSWAGAQGGVVGYGAVQGREVLQDEAMRAASSATRISEGVFLNPKVEPIGGFLVGEYRRPLADPVEEQNGKPGPSRTVKEEDESELEKEAWDLLQKAVATYCGEPVGTIAANDPTDPNPLNYDQVFIRDFIPSAIAFMLKGEHNIVRNFLLHTLQLQSWEKTVDCYSPGQGLMPASFKVQTVLVDGGDGGAETEEALIPDFGEAAIGRVAPVDSGLWWIILLRAFGKCTRDTSLQDRVDVQTGMKMILKVCLADGFDMFPTLLVTDGSCMIDRRMGIHGHPLEIQALFFHALQCAREMLLPEAHELIRLINSRLAALAFHIQEYYWIDINKLNEIYRYKTEEYSPEATNKFNIYPEQVSQWLLEWMPEHGGYFIGNLQPAHMDFRWFTLGNIWSITSSLASKDQAEEILELVELKWEDLIGNMPVKICFPALTEDEWRIITGADPKNTAWSYHNGGSWPTLLWQFTVACIKMGRSDLAEKAVAVAEKRLSQDWWPEYYDTRSGRLIGKQSRLYQTWSIAGYLTAKLMLRDPEAAKWLTCEDGDVSAAIACAMEMNPRRKIKSKLSRDIFIV